MAGWKYRQQQRMGFLTTAEMAQAIEAIARKQNKPMTQVIRDAVQEYLTNQQN